MSMGDLTLLPKHINAGLSAARQATMLTLLGQPRSSYSQSCQPASNATLAKLLTIMDVGPFRAHGLRPALEDLAEIFAEIKGYSSEIYGALRNNGMFCARYVRGSMISISNHSWGTAIDLSLKGADDSHEPGMVLEGIAEIAPIFNAHGWYWGAAFGTEDLRHFEVGDLRMREYQRDGRLTALGRWAEEENLSLGDRGPEVIRLQERLSALGFETSVDGCFGPLTLAALRAFQAQEALRTTGVLDQDSLTALAQAEERIVTVGNDALEVAVGDILRLGTFGERVRSFQAFLLEQGYSNIGVADGYFGKNTLEATKTFQRDHDLVPDGVVGALTLATACQLGLPPVSIGHHRELQCLANSALSIDMIRKLAQLLRVHHRDPIGTRIEFATEGQTYVAILEWHYNERLGKHRGLSVFKEV